MKAIFVVLMVVVLSGCFGEPTLDAADMDSLQVSIQEMTESMSPAEQEDFRRDIVVISFGGPEGLKSMFRSAFQGNLQKGEDFAFENMRKAEGMTVDEMRAFADQLRNQ